MLTLKLQAKETNAGYLPRRCCLSVPHCLERSQKAVHVKGGFFKKEYDSVFTTVFTKK